jgi:hypothetical protein
MATVHQNRPRVQPETLQDETEPFNPSAAEEAYDTGYRLARDGEIGRYHPFPRTPGRIVPGDVQLSFLRGRHEGHVARCVVEARELGYESARLAGISEPPMGMSDREKAAYREGYAEGEDEDARAFEAWVASMEADRLDWAYRDGDSIVSERDIYPMGCVS